MAHLLMIIEQYTSAIEIYFKNRLLEKADKACKIASRKLYG